MIPRRHRAAVIAALALSAAARATPARAQDVGDMALNQLDPAPAGDPFVGVPSPFIGGHLTPRAMVLVDHAAEPLVLQAETPDGTVEGTVVGRQTTLHLGFSFAVMDRLRADLLLPIALAQGGESPPIQEVTFASPEVPAVGDLRLGVRVRVLGEERSPLQLAGAASIFFPTGPGGLYVGEGAVRLAPQLIAGGRLSFLTWTAMGGAMVRGSDNPSSITYGAGVAAVLLDERLQVGPEVYAATPLQETYFRPQNLRSIARAPVTSAELLLSARVRLPLGFQVRAGGGLGLSDAIGTPAFRIVGGIGWEPPGSEAAPAGAGEDAAAAP